MKPTLITFDIFGTVLDWRTGMAEAVRRAGFGFDEAVDLDRVMDLQGQDEQLGYRTYQDITQHSLFKALGVPERAAADIGANAGKWPLFPDSKEGLRRLQEIAPCIAMTNSDRIHGEQIQNQLGFRLSRWICAEDTKVYKPHPDFWRRVAAETGIGFGRHWWHVSAYADYDLEMARELGLTCVFIQRPHCRNGFHHLKSTDLVSLASALPLHFKSD